MEDKETTTYNLYSTERTYRQETLISFYFQPNKEIIKKRAPIDINGERYRLDLETGDITNYTKQDILNSYSASLKRTVIAMNMLLAMNDFDWFWTITFDQQKIDRTNAEEVFNCYKRYINNFSHKYPNFKYMTFPERHEDGCFHFHMLVAGLTVKQMGLVDSGKVCCHWAKKKNANGVLVDLGYCSKEYYDKTKDQHELTDTDGEPIYNITSFAYGFTTASKIVSRERCNSYVKKYVEKALGSTEVFKKRFYYSSNLNVPDVVKKLIGSGFETPHNITLVEGVRDNPLVKASKGQPYVTDYNVMQIKVDNNVKQIINQGYIPVLADEIDVIFGEEQLKF